MSQGGPLWPIYDCTGCGRCTEYCVYGMPVGAMLFEARRKYPWAVAQKAAQELGDDETGDLASELGDEESAERRARGFSANVGRESFRLLEPKSCFFLKSRGNDVPAVWEKVLAEKPNSRLIGKLSGKTWLLHESVWLSRHLGLAREVRTWVLSLRGDDIEIRWPFAQGRDCIDCGGEGAYGRIFPEQARRIALDFWERDQHRAEGILCLSARCARHLRSVVNVPVLSLMEESD